MKEGFFQFSNLSKFSELVHGISKRSYGNMKFVANQPPAKILENRIQFCEELKIDIRQVIFPEIVHGSKIVTVGQSEKGRGTDNLKTSIPQSDGLITAEKGVFLGITVADCLPIMIYDSSNQIIALVHGGWRGILAKIISNTLEKLKNLGSEPGNLVVGIGPGICQKHFVVKNQVLEKFKEDYRQTIFFRNHDGYTDLKKAILLDLLQLGVAKENIEISSDCTVCLNGIYGSFRREGSKTVYQMAVLGLKK